MNLSILFFALLLLLILIVLVSLAALGLTLIFLLNKIYPPQD